VWLLSIRGSFAVRSATEGQALGFPEFLDLFHWKTGRSDAGIDRRCDKRFRL
jgi:hypothetical protein